VATIEIEVKCTCGEDMSKNVDLDVYKDMTIEPCENCLQKAKDGCKDEFYNEGHSEGFEEGKDEGYEEGKVAGREELKEELEKEQ
jgi:flagellar biosynthesis/type III secretory pathway protein FliH